MNKFKYLLLVLSLHMTAFTGESDQNLQNQNFLPDLILAPHLDGTSGLISGFDLVGPDATFNFDNLDGESDIAPLPVQPEVATSATHSSTVQPKQYQCNMCEKQFADRSSLYHHKRTKHKGISFKCNFPSCGKIYMSKEALKKHQKKHNELNSGLTGPTSIPDDLSLLPPELGEFDPAVPVPAPFSPTLEEIMPGLDDTTVVSAPLPPTLEEIIYYHAPHHLPPVQPTSLLLPPTSYNSHNSTLAPVQSLQPAVAVSAPLPFAHQAVADYAPLPVQPVVQAPHHLPPVQPAVAVSAPLPPAYQAVAVSAPLPPVLAAAATAANDLVQSHTCEVCSRSFKFKSKFIRHKRIHTGERPYVCKTCGYSFTQSHHLKRHEEKHTGEKPFVCEICGYSSTQNSNLTRHKGTHSGEKRYVCDQEDCEYSSKDSSNLKRHKRIHTKKLPAASTSTDSSTVVSAPLSPNVSFNELPAAQPEVAVSAPLPPTLSFTNGADQVSDDNDDDIDKSI